MATPSAHKFILNLLGPFLFLLRPWDILVERKLGLIWMWGYLPFILIVLRTTARPFTVTVEGFLVMLVATIGYVVGWIVFSFKDALGLKRFDDAGQTNRLFVFMFLLFIFPSWIITCLLAIIVPIGTSGIVYQNIHWWGYAHLGTMSIIVLVYITTSGPWLVSKKHRKIGFSLLGPVVGLQGLGYFLLKRPRKAIGFLSAGLGVAMLVSWVMGLYLIRTSLPQQVLSFTVLYIAPVLYLGMWLWSIEDARSAVQSEGLGDGTVTDARKEFSVHEQSS